MRYARSHLARMKAATHINNFRIIGARMSVTDDAVIVALIQETKFHPLDLVAKAVMEQFDMGEIWSARMARQRPYSVAFADVPGWEDSLGCAADLVPGLGLIIREEPWTHFGFNTAEHYNDLPYRMDRRWLLDEADRIWQGVKLAKKYVKLYVGIRDEVDKLILAPQMGAVSMSSASAELEHLHLILQGLVERDRWQHYRQLSRLGLWPAPLEPVVFIDSFFGKIADDEQP